MAEAHRRASRRRFRPTLRYLALGAVIIGLLAALVGGSLIAFAGGIGGHGLSWRRGAGRHGGSSSVTLTVSPTINAPTPTPSPSPAPTPTATSTALATPTITPTPSPPCLSFIPTTLTFLASESSGVDPSAQIVNLITCSNQVITWSGVATTTDGASWLNFRGSPDTQNVTFTMNPSDTIQYNIDTQVIENNLQPGSYTGTIAFTSGDGSVSYTIDVALTVGI